MLSAIFWVLRGSISKNVSLSFPLMKIYSFSSSGPDSDMKVLEHQVRLGQQVLAIAVLAILITAPIGAVAVMTAGRNVLIVVMYIFFSNCKNSRIF